MRRLCHNYHDPLTFKAIILAVVGGEYQDYTPSFHIKPITVSVLPTIASYHLASALLLHVLICKIYSVRSAVTRLLTVHFTEVG